MRPISDSGKATGLHPAKHVDGPQEGDNHSSGGRVQVVNDVHPRLSGTDLGKHLRPTGLRLLKLIFHPKTAFDLLTGKLSQRRMTNPTRYLAEIADLCNKPDDWARLLQEVRTLREELNSNSQHQEQFSRTFADQEQKCYLQLGAAIGTFKKHFPPKAMVRHLDMVADLMRTCEGLPYQDPQPTVGFDKLSNRLESTVPIMDKNELEPAIESLETIIGLLNTRFNTPLHGHLDSAKARLAEL